MLAAVTARCPVLMPGSVPRLLFRQLLTQIGDKGGLKIPLRVAGLGHPRSVYCAAPEGQQAREDEIKRLGGFR